MFPVSTFFLSFRGLVSKFNRVLSILRFAGLSTGIWGGICDDMFEYIVLVFSEAVLLIVIEVWITSQTLTPGPSPTSHCVEDWWIRSVQLPRNAGRGELRDGNGRCFFIR